MKLNDISIILRITWEQLERPLGLVAAIMLLILTILTWNGFVEFPTLKDDNVTYSLARCISPEWMAEHELRLLRETYNYAQAPDDRWRVKRVILDEMAGYPSAALPPRLKEFLDSIRTGGG